MTIEELIFLEHLKSSMSVIKDVGIFGLQSLITVNAGAIIVLLTFIPNIVGKNEVTVSITKIKNAMVFYIIGLSFAFLSIIATYVLSQLGVSGVNFNFWFHLAIMLVPAFISFLFFCFGSILAMKSVEAKGVLRRDRKGRLIKET